MVKVKKKLKQVWPTQNQNRGKKLKPNTRQDETGKIQLSGESFGLVHGSKKTRTPLCREVQFFIQ